MCQLADPGNSQFGLCMSGMKRIQGMDGAVGVIAGLKVTALLQSKAGDSSETPYVRADVRVGTGVTLTAARDVVPKTDSGDEGDTLQGVTPASGTVSSPFDAEWQPYESDDRFDVFPTLAHGQKCFG